MMKFVLMLAVLLLVVFAKDALLYFIFGPGGLVFALCVVTSAVLGWYWPNIWEWVCHNDQSTS